jgi:AAA domain
LDRLDRQDRKETLSRYVDDDGNLTPEGEMGYLRFRAGAKTVDELLDSAGPDWLIEGWLATSATMVAGAPESGKSSLVASMAAAVASGEPWLGTPISSERSGPVVVIGSDPSDISQWAKKAHALSVPADAWELIDFDRKRWEAYEELAAELESRLLVFDNITSALDGPINDADPNAVLGPLKRIATAGTPVVVIAHTGKGGSKDPMGPTAYKAWRRHGIHVSGKGDYKTLTRAGNIGAWEEVVVRGTQIGAAIQYQLADDGEAAERNRSPQRLDNTAEIAKWIVKNCQHAGLNATARKVSVEFGLNEGTVKQSLIKGLLSRLVTYSGQGGSTVWKPTK